MSHANPPRNRTVHPGRPGLHPTQFAALRKTDSLVGLQRTTEVSSEEVHAWLFGNGLNLPSEAADVLAQRLSAAQNPNPIARVRLFEAVFEEHFGYSYEDGENVELAARHLDAAGLGDLALSVRKVATAARRQGRAVSAPIFADGSAEYPADVNSPEVQSGQVLDNIITVDGRIFTRAGTAQAGQPDNIRFQANRELTDEDLEKLGPLMGYAMMSTLGGESAGDPERDSPFSFVMAKDTSKGTYRFDVFEEDLNGCVEDGSPIRTTDRKGPGTRGTRAVQGLDDPDLTFEIYYDNVYRS